MDDQHFSDIRTKHCKKKTGNKLPLTQYHEMMVVFFLTFQLLVVNLVTIVFFWSLLMWRCKKFSCQSDDNWKFSLSHKWWSKTFHHQSCDNRIFSSHHTYGDQKLSLWILIIQLTGFYLHLFLEREKVRRDVMVGDQCHTCWMNMHMTDVVIQNAP